MSIDAQSTIDTMMPLVNVKKVILENNSEEVYKDDPHIQEYTQAAHVPMFSGNPDPLEYQIRPLTVTLNFGIKDQIKVPSLSKWLGHEFTKYINICIVKVGNRSTKNAIQSNTATPMVGRIVAQYNAGNIVADDIKFLNLFTDVVGGPDGSVTEKFEAYTKNNIYRDAAGNQTYDVTFTEYYEFTDESIKTLAFYVFTYVDVVALQGDYPGLDTTQLSAYVLGGQEIIQGFTGDVTTEVVFSNGRVKTGARIYKDAQGQIWNGPVHFHSPGPGITSTLQEQLGFSPKKTMVMSGDTFDPGTSKPLYPTIINNSKLQDLRLRHKQKLPKIHLTLADMYPALRVLSKRASRDITIPPEPVLSDLFLTTRRPTLDGQLQYINGTFFLDMARVLFDNAKFPAPVMNSADSQAKREVMKFSKIVSINVFKRTIRSENPVANAEYKNPLTQPVQKTIVSTADKFGDVPTLQTVTGENGNIKEVEFSFAGVGAPITGDKPGRTLRTFTFSDYDVQVGEKYQYGVRIELVDSTAKVLGGINTTIMNAITAVDNLRAEADKPAFLITGTKQLNNAALLNFGSGDGSLIDATKQKISTALNRVFDFFKASDQAFSQLKQGDLIKKLNFLLNDIDGMTIVSDFLSSIYNQVYNLLERNFASHDKKLGIGSPSLNGLGPSSRTLTIEYTFKEIAEIERYSYNVLDTTSTMGQSGLNAIVLRDVESAIYNSRCVQEKNKFFGNIDTWAIGNNVQMALNTNMRFSFLTPSMMYDKVGGDSLVINTGNTPTELGGYADYGSLLQEFLKLVKSMQGAGCGSFPPNLAAPNSVAAIDITAGEASATPNDVIFGVPDPSDTGGLFDLDEGTPEVTNTALYFPHTSMDDFNETKFIYGNIDAQTTALFNYLVINDTLIEDILKFFGSGDGMNSGFGVVLNALGSVASVPPYLDMYPLALKNLFAQNSAAGSSTATNPAQLSGMPTVGAITEYTKSVPLFFFYSNIFETQYLASFKKTSSGFINLKAPVFKTYRGNAPNDVSQRKYLLCRLKRYEGNYEAFLESTATQPPQGVVPDSSPQDLLYIPVKEELKFDPIDKYFRLVNPEVLMPSSGETMAAPPEPTPPVKIGPVGQGNCPDGFVMGDDGDCVPIDPNTDEEVLLDAEPVFEQSEVEGTAGGYVGV